MTANKRCFATLFGAFTMMVCSAHGQPVSPDKTTITKAVAMALEKTPRAQAATTSVTLLARIQPGQRPDYAAAIIEQVARKNPTGLTTVAASLSRAYPELAASVAVRAAKESPVQLPDVVRAVVVAAPNRMAKTLAALSQAFPENRAAIKSAAAKAFPQSVKQIDAAVAAAAVTAEASKSIGAVQRIDIAGQANTATATAVAGQTGTAEIGSSDGRNGYLNQGQPPKAPQNYGAP